MSVMWPGWAHSATGDRPSVPSDLPLITIDTWVNRRGRAACYLPLPLAHALRLRLATGYGTALMVSLSSPSSSPVRLSARTVSWSVSWSSRARSRHGSIPRAPPISSAPLLRPSGHGAEDKTVSSPLTGVSMSARRRRRPHEETKQGGNKTSKKQN